ncbi:hypothetical protein [Burkholderia vietnamiensis]|uniref:hypothetical protein n=1 Tax=Burkholderia vietnamiensis TaxID=60552 RepID=UPI001B95E0D9|nr:hypothetical protein [Burkholderia vietnamiensis]MBR8054167.1 hypothetical protein [Burkholderia vietnamiensis]
MKFEPPICWVCHRMVDYFEVNHEFIAGRRIFTARCHGETQVQYLDDRDLERLGPNGISIGYAFAPDSLSVIAPILADGVKA